MQSIVVGCGLAAFGLALSWLLTGGMRRYALAAQIIDIPNSRSSHSQPTPRGGGVAIVVSFSALIGGLASVRTVPAGLTLILLTSGLLVALMGFLDDRRPLPARWRFLAQMVAAAWALWCMGGFSPVPVFGVSIDLGWIGVALASAYLVWMTNLYNFMDGIDGIAGLEGVTVSLGGGLCWWLAAGTSDWMLVVSLATCIGGFLIWNLPPAKIFMGDVGSGFIGFTLGAISLWTAQAAPQLFWCWFILIGCFMVDATTTLLRRVQRGERFYEAHRSHAYQYASRKHGSHKAVSLAVGAINLLWLLPLAMAVATGRLDGVAGVLIAYAPLVWLAYRYKAGDRAAQAA